MRHGSPIEKHKKVPIANVEIRSAVIPNFIELDRIRFHTGLR
jgi:hypothetical protein